MPMMMLGPAEEKQCTELRSTAEKYPLSIERLRKTLARMETGDMNPDPQNGLQTVTFASRHTVTFTVEEALDGLFVRRASFATDRPGAIPQPIMVERMLEWLGYQGGLKNSHYEVKDLLRPGYKCIEVIQPMSGDMGELIRACQQRDQSGT